MIFLQQIKVPVRNQQARKDRKPQTSFTLFADSKDKHSSPRACSHRKKTPGKKMRKTLFRRERAGRKVLTDFEK